LGGRTQILCAVTESGLTLALQCRAPRLCWKGVACDLPCDTGPYDIRPGSAGPYDTGLAEKC